MAGKVFFNKYPALQQFLSNELKLFVDTAEDEIKPKIQCILLILSRLYPSYHTDSSQESVSPESENNFQVIKKV